LIARNGQRLFPDEAIQNAISLHYIVDIHSAIVPATVLLPKVSSRSRNGIVPLSADGSTEGNTPAGRLAQGHPEQDHGRCAGDDAGRAGAGGEDYLLEQATANPRAFLSLLGRILPTQLTGKDDAPLIPERASDTERVVGAFLAILKTLPEAQTSDQPADVPSDAGG
jgi:hypothetical protein